MTRLVLKSLEYNIVWHCTNSCIACSHMAPINPKEFVPIDVFAETVNVAAKIVEPVIFTLIGGEPLLHPDLIELIAIAKASGISENIQVTTNAVLLNRMPEAFWEADFDTLRITRYPNCISDKQWKAWKSKARTYRKKFHGGPNLNFYKPLLPECVTEEEAKKAFTECPWKDHCTTLDRGNLYLCPQALFFPYHFLEIEQDKNGLWLGDSTPEMVADYMNRIEPIEACKRCSYVEYTPWRQVARKDWLKESTHYA